jgi:hypothetical protein
MFLGKHLWNFYNEYQERKIIKSEIDILLSQKEVDIPIFLEGVFEFYFMDHYSYQNPIPFLTYGWISRNHFQNKAYQRMGFSKQSELEQFGLLSFIFPEPLRFPEYMGRISSEFQLRDEIKTDNLRLGYFINSSKTVEK